MPKICILTDSSAQFPRPDFVGSALVSILALEQEAGPPASLIAPTPDAFLQTYMRLGQHYDGILVVTLSSALLPVASAASQAAAQFGGRTQVKVLDSRHTGPGLGLLVELAARSAQEGKTLQQIEDLLRASTSSVYSLFCVVQWEQLIALHGLSPAQSAAGNLLGVMPVFSLEENQLSHLQKVRTYRHLLELFQEFILEYDAPCHIAIVHGKGVRMRTKSLRQCAQASFPNARYSEHILNPTLAHLFGSEAVGLVISDVSFGKNPAC